MIVLITGGASGLGEAITRRLAKDSNCVVFFTYSKSETNAKKIQSEYSNAFSIKCDFTNEGDVNNLKDQLISINPDVLINNAYFGAFIGQYFHKTPAGDFLSEFEKNVIPSISITQAAINCFRRKKGGKIITILTAALLNVPPVGSSLYVANKAYIHELAKIWATENIKYNITSNTVSPSFMLTGFTKHIDERVIEQITDNHPLKKILTTDETADTVFFLVNASNQINGIDIIINAAANIG